MSAISLETKQTLELNKIYSVTEASQCLSISAVSIWRAIYNDHLKTYRIGRRRVISGDQLIAWRDSGGQTDACHNGTGTLDFAFHAERKARRISSEFLGRERRALPRHIFESEYLCEFHDSEFQLFRTDHIHSALHDVQMWDLLQSKGEL